jgi:succinate dehydrogenase/fumarate reductase cytochrome b subunit
VYRVSPEQRLRAYAEVWPAHPRLGVWAWRLQRISGLALVAYAIWHIVTVTGGARHPERLAQMVTVLRHPAVFAFLMAGLAYHSANGVRMVLFDLGIESMRGRAAFWGFLALAGVIVAASLGRLLARGL